MRNAAILARVSRETQETESQIFALKQCAMGYDFDVPDELIFQEKITGMDSFDKDERKSLQQLKDAIEKRTDIEAVFIWELTRLSRNPYYLIDQLRWFNEHRTPIYIYYSHRWTRDIETNEENLDTTNYIFGAASYGQEEWNRIKERTKRGRDLKARRGLFVGHIADGYKVVFEKNEKRIDIDDERAEIIRSVFDLYVKEGFSTNQIAAQFNEQGIPTFNALEAQKNKDNPKFSQSYKKRGTSIRVAKTQTKWMGSTVAQILHNKWYIGQRKYLDETYSVPPIVSQEIFDEAQVLLEKNRSDTTKKTSATYPLKSLLVCGECGRFLYGHRSGINTSYYCSSIETGKKCGLEGIAKQNADWMVWDLIAGTAIMAYARDEDIQDLRKVLGYDKINIEELEAKIKKLNQAIEQKQSAIKQCQRKIAECNIEMKVCESDMSGYYLDIKNQAERDVEKGKKELDAMLKERSNSQIIIEKSENIDDAIIAQFENIIKNKDIVSAAKIIKLFVKRITLYSIQRYYKFLDVELFSGLHKYALYNARKFNGNYYSIPFAIKYDPTKKIFMTENPCFKLKDLIERFKDKSESDIMKELHIDFCQFLSLLNGKNIEPQVEERLNVLLNKYSIPNLAGQFNIDQLVVWLKNNEEALPLSKLEEQPSTEDYMKWREQSRQWDRKRKQKRLEERKNRRQALNQQYDGYRSRIQIALELGIKKLTVWRDISQRRLPAEKVNGVWMVSPENFEKYKKMKISN